MGMSLLKQDLWEIQVNVSFISIFFAFRFLVSFCLCGFSCGNYILLWGSIFFSPSFTVTYHHHHTSAPESQYNLVIRKERHGLSNQKLKL